MTTPRVSHTATLLPNGKVLIVGGSSNVASAELYDPATGTFAPTGSMTTARVWHTATLLNNGTVLIVGGGLNSAEIYDPATGAFAASVNMHEPSCDTATLLPNGKVLITRGVIYYPTTDDETFVRHAELYDPATGTFAFTGDMTYFHSSPTATLLSNGRVFIAGGDVGDGDGASPRAEIYDPSNGSFAAIGNMTEKRESHTSTLLSDGSVLFAGGHNIWYGASAEIYDPLTPAGHGDASRLSGVPPRDCPNRGNSEIGAGGKCGGHS